MPRKKKRPAAPKPLVLWTVAFMLADVHPSDRPLVLRALKAWEAMEPDGWSEGVDAEGEYFQSADGVRNHEIPKAIVVAQRAAMVEFTEEMARELSFLPLNDDGNGQRFRRRFGNLFIATKEGDLYAWTGARFEAEGAEQIALNHGALVAGGIRAEVEHLKAETEEETEDLKTARRRFAIGSGNLKKVKDMITFFKAAKPLASEALNRDPRLIVVRNGTLRLRPLVEIDPEAEAGVWTIDFTPSHDPADLATQWTPIVYDPKATCPKWMAFLARFQPAAEIRLFLQTYVALQLLGLREQQVLFSWGTGANGKSTFQETVRRLLGDYGAIVSASTVLAATTRDTSAPAPDVHRLRGIRGVLVSELPKGAKIDAAFVKLMTGGSSTVTRTLNKEPVEWRPIFTVHVDANDKPRIDDTDDGIWRRVRILKWPVTIPVEERRNMDEVLAEYEEELPGILNWALEGAVIYAENGLKIPPSVLHETLAYREMSDPLGAFIRSCVRTGLEDAFKVQARPMYDAYLAWCNTNAVRAMSETRFPKEMEAHGIARHQSRVAYYLNCELIPLDERPAGDGRPFAEREDD